MSAPTPCDACAVRDRALCGALDDGEIAALNRVSERRRLARGETLLWAGDESLVCANLLSGLLKLSDISAEGREQIVGLIYPSEFVGRPFAATADFTITALADSELCVFPRTAFEAILGHNPKMERLLLERTFAALDEARGRMSMLARQSAGARVAAFLLQAATRAAGGGCRAWADGPLTFDLPLTRGQMAELLGLSIETVSRQLTRLKEGGAIALPGARAVTIRDAGALEAEAAR